MITSAKNIKTFTIIGSGTLGARIGLQAALSGYEVTLYDISDQAFRRAEKDFSRIKRMLVKQGTYSSQDFDHKANTIKKTTNLEKACNSTDFISESVLEDEKVKKQVWKQIGNHVGEHAILTTNTSFLLPSMFAMESGAPERFAAFHFHDVFTARVVDIMPHGGTDPSIITTLQEIGKRLNQIPVVIRKETPGYIFNKVFSTILMTAGKMLAEGIADMEDVDRSWMGNYGMRTGPFGMMDEVGLDTVYHVARKMPGSENDKFIAILESMIKNGLLGIKTGKGFYDYPNPKFKDKDFLFH